MAVFGLRDYEADRFPPFLWSNSPSRWSRVSPLIPITMRPGWASVLQRFQCRHSRDGFV